MNNGADIMKMIFLGAPGAGKGTQAEKISARLSIPTISTGNMLREAVKNCTEIGLRAKAFMDAGQLVPDEVIIGIVAERIEKSDCKNGYILDGVPRTLPQAEALERAGVVFDAVVSIEVSDDEIVKRLSGRRVCETCGATFHVVDKPPAKDGVCDFCGAPLVIRKDDSPETIKSRLDVFHSETEPLKGFYETRGRLKLVPGVDSIDKITQLVSEALGI